MIAPLLLYDGTCGFCAASVQFILRHERHGVLRFAPLQSELAAAIRGRHPELEGVDSMVWVENGGEGRGERVAVRSDAALEVARYLGWPWRALGAGWLVPRGLRDAVYDLVARHRHRLFSDPEACYLPPSDVRSRFIDS
jgi:predicted DCC family thiol-disulfide oxidoreductase YuxK